MKHYIELTKPTITWLILMSTAIGYYYGLRGGELHIATLFHALLGTGLLASGTATLNEWFEREADAKMRRTRMRPIPSGRVTPRRALIFGIVLSVVGFLDLLLAVNLLAAAWGLISLTTYLFLYTPLKARTPHSTTIGAFPGAMPPLIGYAAAAGRLGAEAWILFAILFLWQFPHFLSIAWIYREDYGRAGIVMLPVVEPDGKSTALEIVICSALLIPASLAPGYVNMSGKPYLFGALALGLVFLYTGLRVMFERTNLRARHVLRASVIYLPLLFGLMLLDRSVL
ncbi:MAG: heme o synthase [Rhodospirillales bacterium]